MKLSLHIAFLGAMIATLHVGVAAAAALGTVSDVACAPTRSDVAAALADTAVHVTRDGGKNWSRVPMPHVDAEDESLQTADAVDADALLSDEPEQTTDGENEEVAVDTTEAAVSSETGVRIAVDDNGNVAKCVGYSVVISGGQGIRHLRFKNTIVDAAFDATGRLIVLSEEGVWCVSSVSGGFRLLYFVPLRASRALLRGLRGSVRVLTRDGIYAIDENRRAMRLVAVSAAVVGAVRFDDTETESWLVAANGELVAISVDGGRQALGIFASAVTRISVGAHGAIRLYDVREGWRELRAGRLCPISVTAVTADAAGRFWTADASGVQAPAQQQRSRVSGLVESTRPDTADAAVRLQQMLPTPPRCRRYRAAVLPEAVAAFGYRRTAYWEVGETHATGEAQEISAGISLVWRAGDEDMDACLARHHRYQQERLRETRRAVELSHALIEAERRLLNATALKDAIEARCTRDRSAALLELASRASKY